MPGTFTWEELARRVERIISDEIADRTEDLWDENTISFNLVQKIRQRLSGATIVGDREKTTIAARLYKARGAVETKFGDLAVSFNFSFRDGTTLDGVAFYEAKKREWKSQKLAAIRKGQLGRIHNNLWNARLLVYDREPILSAAFEAGLDRWFGSFAPRVFLEDGRLVVPMQARGMPVSVPYTHAGVIPLGPVLATAKFDTSLYKYALPWSYQLCFRNFQGLDLDHDAETVKAVVGHSQKYGVPRTTLLVSVRRGPGDGLPPLPDVNGDVLEAVDVPQPPRQ